MARGREHGAAVARGRDRSTRRRSTRRSRRSAVSCRSGRSCSAAAAAPTSAPCASSPGGTAVSRVVWIDAHGDLNTPESSPSGNAWGMPLRMLIDAGDVDPNGRDAARARSLDPPEEDFIEAAGIRRELGDLPERRLRRARLRRVRAAARSTSSCRSRAASPPASLEQLLASVPAARRRRASPASSPPSATRRPDALRARARLVSPGACSVTVRAWRGSKLYQCPRPGSTSRSSTSTLRPRQKQAPEHLPEVRVALSRRRACGGALGVRALRPPLPDAGSRPDRLVRRRGLVRRGGRRRPLGRPARLLRPAPVCRAALRRPS